MGERMRFSEAERRGCGFKPANKNRVYCNHGLGKCEISNEVPDCPIWIELSEKALRVGGDEG